MLPSPNNQGVGKIPSGNGQSLVPHFSIPHHTHNGVNSSKIRFSDLRFDHQLPTAYGGTGASAVSAARVNLGLAIGTDVQAYDATLASIAALGTAANRMIYTTGVDTWAESTITSAARNILDDTGPADTRSTLGLVIGTNVQAWDAALDDIAGLTLNTGDMFYVSASGDIVDLAIGTEDQVLTVSASGVPVWATQSSSSTPRRNLGVQLATTSVQLTGTTTPTADTNINGLRCSVGTDGATSFAKVNITTTSTLDFYDKNPEFNISVGYTEGSAGGNGFIYFGDSANTGTAAVQTQTNKSMFIYADTVAGSTTWYAVNANGTTNTNSSLSGITSAQVNHFRVVKDSTTSIKYYSNYTLKATHTTNLPSGDNENSSNIFTVFCRNDSGDTTTRTALYGFLDILIDSPTG